MLRGVGTPSAASCAWQGLVPAPVSGFAVRHCGLGELRNARVGSKPKVRKGVLRRTDRAVVVKTLAIQKNLVDQVRAGQGESRLLVVNCALLWKNRMLSIYSSASCSVWSLKCFLVQSFLDANRYAFWHKPALRLVGT